MDSNTKKVILIVVVALVVIGGGVALFMYDTAHPELKNPWAHKSTRDLALTCLDREYFVQHIHPVLKVHIGTSQAEIPANIGIEGPGGSMEQVQTTSSCLHPIHTHDASGTIHVESPEIRDYKLGDFFAVWGQVFNKDQILENKVDATHRIRMTLNGQENTDFENLTLVDKDQIDIYYEEIK